MGYRDWASGVALDTVAQTVVTNYGAANQNAAQLQSILDWAKDSGLMNSP